MSHQTSKPTIKIKFVDFWDTFPVHNNDFLNILAEKFNVEFSDDPDLIFYSVFGHEHLKYSCIRVFYTGENILPDFNLCDYAISFSHIKFQDRHLRMPLYALVNYKESYTNAYNLHTTPFKEKSKFCNFIYSNGGADKRREWFFQELSKYKQVTSGGKFLNNIGGRVENKLNFISDFKFSISFENSSDLGYITEKLTEAKGVGSIPIYWGAEDVSEYFNTESFINCHDYDSLEQVIEHVIRVDESIELQEKYHQAPFSKIPLESYHRELKEFLLNIAEKGTLARSQSQETILYTKRLKAMNIKPIKYFIRKMLKHKLL